MMKNSTKLFAMSASVLFAACGGDSQQAQPQVAEQAAPYQALDLSAMDTSVRPQDDFYGFVNGGWQKTAKIPADKPSWGAFNMLRERTDENCLLLLESLLKEHFEQGSEGQKIKAIYSAFINWEARNQAGLSPIEGLLKKIDAIASMADLEKYINEATLLGENSLYGWGVYADMKDSKMNAIYLGSPELGMGRDYYQKENDTNKEALAQYQKYVGKILTIMGYKNADEVAGKIVQFEKDMAKLYLTNEEDRNPNLSYNPHTAKELGALVKGVSLPNYLESVGVKTDKVIVGELRFYKKFDTFFNQKNLPLIKDYLKYHLVANNDTNLTEEIDTASFEFYNKYLQGQQEKRAMNKRGLSLINGTLGEAFGKLYVEKYFTASAKEQMITLVDYLKKSFAVHIQNLQWMSDATKEKALAKLGKFTVKVGYPDKWKDYSKMIINDNDGYFAHLQNIRRWKYEKSLEKIGQPVDKSEWGMTPQTVNAYYNPLHNEIVFPAAILQSPFFDEKADPALNFGGIGAVIGHEITHGFDDSGAEFDGDGNLSNWWTEQDKENFKNATAALAKQYDAYEPVKGTFINGTFTSGENIADLGGVAIAYDALKMYLTDKGEKPLIDNFTQEQRFFISWATVWRTLSSEKYLINQTKTDPHSAGYFRAFGPLVNVDAWYDAFGVKEGDKLYKKPEERIKIW